MVKFETTNEINVFFTSDLHLGHQQPFVWENRGFSSVDEHDNFIIDVTNDTIRENDIFYILGDFCLNTPLEKFELYISRIKCQNIRMLWGNHPNPHQKLVYEPTLKEYFKGFELKNKKAYPIQYKNVLFLGDYTEIVVNGQYIVLFHYPISVWNYIAKGAWHLCGHSHYSFAPSTASDLTSKILDVGWDGHGKPLSFEEIKLIMDKKGVIVVDHHK